MFAYMLYTSKLKALKVVFYFRDQTYFHLKDI